MRGGGFKDIRYFDLDGSAVQKRGAAVLAILVGAGIMLRVRVVRIVFTIFYFVSFAAVIALPAQN